MRFQGLKMSTPGLLFMASSVVLAACVAANDGPRTVDSQLMADVSDGDNWPSYGRTYDESHFSPLDQINTSSIGRLKLAWSTDLGVLQRPDTQPLEANGVVYATAGLSVIHAINAQTGALLWRYDPDSAETAGNKLRASWGVRGLALWKDKVIVGTQDGRLIALGTRDGKLLWSTQALPTTDESTITGAPRVYNGIVVIGYGGAERTRIRGAVQAFDADTGKFLWRFYTVPGNPADGFENEAMAAAAKTWSGEWWKFGGGGTVWNAMTYDPELDRLYIGTGNGGPWNYRIRNPKGGDALYLASIVALDAKTGKYIWHFQENPNEAWDYNATMDIQLATLAIEGRQRKVLMQAPKNGFFFVIDRQTGKLISADKLGKVTWATGYDLKTGRPIEAPGIRYDQPIVQWPGTFGLHNWQPMAWNPSRRLSFIPSIHTADAYSTTGLDPKWQPDKNNWNTGLAWGGDSAKRVHVPTDEFSSSLQAWDPVGHKRAWSVATPGIVNGGVMATAGDLVFQGQIDGTFNAYAAKDGRKLWSFQAGVSVLGAPITYSVGGKQYVTVMSGPPSGSPAAILPQQSKFGWRYRDHPRRLLTFVLDGTAKLPATPPPGPEHPLLSDAVVVDAALARTGEGLYNKNCMTCHGVGAVASGGAPDLRASGVTVDLDALKEIVQNGALLKQGMPQFKELSDTDLKTIQHYIRQQAKGASSTAQRTQSM